MQILSKFRLCGCVQGSISSKLLYYMLHELAEENGSVVISQRKISKALHISKSTVSRNLRQLQQGGYIDIQPRCHEDGGRAANQYFIR